MRLKNNRLVVIVVVVAVAAVTGGGALAYRQGPQVSSGTEAAPLSSSRSPTPSPTPAPTPPPAATPTPSLAPSTKPTPSKNPQTPTVPTVVDLEVAGLPTGRAPRLTYRLDREVRGGGRDLKIPGSGGITDIARLGDSVLAATLTADGKGELLKLNAAGAVIRRTPSIYTLASATDQSAAAYASNAPVVDGQMTYGATLYSERGGAVESVELPDVLSIEVVAYANGQVYYRASAKGSEKVWKLYSWTPGSSKSVLMKTVLAPLAVSSDGRLASSLPPTGNDAGCSTVREVASGEQLFQTCDKTIAGFTPDGAVAIATPAYSDGNCAISVAVLNARNGAVLRQWRGCFYRVVAEDNDHLLMVAVVSGGGQAPFTKSAIVRCSIRTGVCERATEVTAAKQVDFAR
jgi:hypothetical protein